MEFQYVETNPISYQVRIISEISNVAARSHILLVTRSADNSMVEVALVDSAGKVYAANGGKYINSISLLQPSILVMGNSLVSCCGRFCWHCVCV